MPIDAFDPAELRKVELHVHLEGSIAADTALELARRHGADPGVLPLAADSYPARFRDFHEFVSLYLAVSGLIKDPEDLEVIAAAFARAQRNQQIVYSEATFTAITHVRNGMDPGAMWEALATGLASVAETEVRLIVDTPRDLGMEAAARTVELVEHRSTGARSDAATIAGLGLSGVEGSLPEGDFTVLREAADRLGLGLSVHAGETGGPERIWAALDDLGADRIGHGVACATDEALLDRLKREQVPLEVCPSSNVALGIFRALEDHPFRRLWETGLNITVNSDDPPFFSTTLTDELRHVRRLAELSRGDLQELQARAADAAFVDDGRRAALIASLG